MISNIIINFVNLLIVAISALIKTILSILPTSPFESEIYATYSAAIEEYLPTLNWFVPIDSMSKILLVWLTAIGIYYLVSIALRWAKAIS